MGISRLRVACESSHNKARQHAAFGCWTRSARRCGRRYAQIQIRPPFVKSLFFFGLTLTSLACFGSDTMCPANITGKTQHWAIAVCELRASTDDFENDKVQKCISVLIKTDKIDMNKEPVCALNTKYKTELCKYSVEEKYEKSISECLQSTKNIPEVVLNDGA